MRLLVCPLPFRPAIPKTLPSLRQNRLASTPVFDYQHVPSHCPQSRWFKSVLTCNVGGTPGRGLATVLWSVEWDHSNNKHKATLDWMVY